MAGGSSVAPEYERDRVRVFRRTDLGRPDLYRGVANVILLIVTLRPDRFPDLVERVDHPIVQRWALFVVSPVFAMQTDCKRWIGSRDNPSEPVTAIAIVHALEVMRELGQQSETSGHRATGARRSRVESAAQMLSDLV